jgi:hypothetical protein
MTNLKTTDFTITELEVWEVIGAEPVSTKKEPGIL